MTLTTIPAGTNLVADYASPGVDPFYLQARGFKAVVRYINGDLAKGLTHWKILTIPERDRIWKAGLGLILVFEKSATRFLGGYNAGRQDGAEAQADAYMLAYEGVILVAFDSDVTSSNIAAAKQYWQGFRETCPAYPLGVYADWDLIEAVKTQSALNWQPNAGFWSSVWDALTKRFRSRGTHPAAHVKQKTGYNTPSGGIDPNDVLKPIQAQSGITPPIPPFDPANGQFSLWPINPKKPILTPGATYPPPFESSRQACLYMQGVILHKAGGNITLTGWMDPHTVERVKDLQRLFKLTVDGVVGAQTWAVVDYLAVH